MAGSDKKEQRLDAGKSTAGGNVPFEVQGPDVTHFVMPGDNTGLIPRVKLDSDQSITIATWDGQLPGAGDGTDYFRLQIARANSNEWTLVGTEHSYVGGGPWVPLVFTLTSAWFLEPENEGGLGREITRSFDLNGVEQQLTQVYNAVDALVSRTLKEGPNPLRAETYGYDSRGRLVLYTSEGDQSPVDPYGKVIKKQVFRFDAIDNLTRVTTTYENLDGTSGTNVADYFYGGVDPAQLTKVTNTPTGFGYPAEIVLEYDDDGHMVRDEEGRTLEYDELGRLTHVSGLAGETPTDYHYDPQDTLSWTEGEHGQDQRFYQDDNLVNQLQGSKNSTFMRGDGVVLAERQEGDGPKF